MPTHSENRHMPYTAEQMYSLVADVASYPEFLPWCSAARIRSRTSQDKSVVMLADLVISFKVFREKFGSRVTLFEEAKKVDTEYLDGPFSHMHNTWSFKPNSERSCTVTFAIDYAFKSRTLEVLMGSMFDTAFRKFASAFEARADVVYGPTTQ